MKRLKNNRGEGQISVGVKIILAVVIGALILGGLYLLFDRVILRNTDRQIKELMAAAVPKCWRCGQRMTVRYSPLFPIRMMG